ncbi:hypothetical protein [Clostridium sp.]|uniref:hypothetical protein n=1 Tax=Clostridium sp. TaxID=1506 RepID=UPI00290F877B|nr:hypothetical protein [Clostridium sp.]MDU5107772.1 hypothetical protein [Clostridium sp.]
MTISMVLASSHITLNIKYTLQDIYKIIEMNASNLHLKKDWKHSVRGVLSSRKVSGRTIIYHGNAEYSFY